MQHFIDHPKNNLPIPFNTIHEGVCEVLGVNEIPIRYEEIRKFTYELPTEQAQVIMSYFQKWVDKYPEVHRAEIKASEKYGYHVVSFWDVANLG